MRGELHPITESGRRFVALAEEHAADFATRAADHDREGSFPFENVEAMKQSGFIAGPVAEEFGGLGVTSVHDIGVAMSRLARGDGSTAIAVNMHLAATWTMNRMRSSGIASGNTQMVPVLEGLSRAIAAGQMITAIFGTEAGTSIAYPNAEITRDGESFELNGNKIFGTLSPVATMYFVPSRMKGDDGEYVAAVAMLGRGTPGVELKDNWDALGMRGSGSGDVVFKNVKLNAGNIVGGDEKLGAQTTPSLEMAIAGNVGLIACFTGIAEAAADIVVDAAKKRRKGPTNTLMAERQWMQHLIGEMMVDLETCRGMLSYAARVCDEYVEATPKRDAPLDEALERQRQFQSAKYVVNRRAIDVVDKALTASGGAGYMTKHPLSRLYRDVRAGPFMQPFSPPEALEFIGRVTLDQDPEVN